MTETTTIRNLQGVQQFNNLSKLDKVFGESVDPGQMSVDELFGKLSEFKRMTPNDRRTFLRNLDRLERETEMRLCAVRDRLVEITKDVHFGNREAIDEDRSLLSERRVLREKLSTIQAAQEKIVKDRQLRNLVGQTCEQLLKESVISGREALSALNRDIETKQRQNLEAQRMDKQFKLYSLMHSKQHEKSGVGGLVGKLDDLSSEFEGNLKEIYANSPELKAISIPLSNFSIKLGMSGMKGQEYHLTKDLMKEISKANNAAIGEMELESKLLKGSNSSISELRQEQVRHTKAINNQIRRLLDDLDGKTGAPVSPGSRNTRSGMDIGKKVNFVDGRLGHQENGSSPDRLANPSAKGSRFKLPSFRFPSFNLPKFKFPAFKFPSFNLSWTAFKSWIASPFIASRALDTGYNELSRSRSSTLE